MTNRMALVLGMALAALQPAHTWAQEGRELSAARQAEGRHVLATARGLISYGEARGDAMALVVAARMIESVPGRVLADGQTGEAGAGSTTDYDIEAVLRKAEALSRGDASIAKAIAELRATATADEETSCYWEYYCYYNGECEYTYSCW